MRTLAWRTRRRWAFAILLAGLPVYVVLAVTIVSWFDRPSVLIELAIYLSLGLLWVLPLRGLFQGVARTDREADGDGTR